MGDNLISINQDKCKKDGLCIRICPKVFSPDITGIPIAARPQFCNGCGHCLLICPAGAIQIRDISSDRIHPVEAGLLPSFEQVREMIRARRSIRNFLGKPVDKELIEKIIDAARLAPSAKNTQSTRFTVIQDPEVLKKIAVMSAQWIGRSARKLRNPVIRTIFLMRGLITKDEFDRWISQYEMTAHNMEKGIDTILYNAPLLILFHSAKRTRFADVNANLALQNATFAGHALGIGSFYTGYVVSACTHDRAIPDMLGIPRGHRVFAGLAMGHTRVAFKHWIDRTKDDVKWIG
ncbi:MAG: nitroreductase family protein [Syntrophorhabdaceae bacterium]